MHIYTIYTQSHLTQPTWIDSWYINYVRKSYTIQQYHNSRVKIKVLQFARIPTIVGTCNHGNIHMVDFKGGKKKWGRSFHEEIVAHILPDMHETTCPQWETTCLQETFPKPREKRWRDYQKILGSDKMYYFSSQPFPSPLMSSQTPCACLQSFDGFSIIFVYLFTSQNTPMQ